MRVSKVENLLLNAMTEVGYGEIYSVIISPANHSLNVDVSEARREVIETLRTGKEISILVIHQGEPAYMEIDDKTLGFRCRKKHKLPTK
jgi:hypothetical protein